ncbi:LLM class flavin-dependent oxidoreductase [Dactylosporangium sp. NPDC051484]|uniref:LLM class flavin-dependent oxidoreductase n=1 Tax=Dactylosporangium sp. NPDC051484 TaxID=3154942 RepID=UPI00344FCB74
MTLHVALEIDGAPDPADIEALSRTARAAEQAGFALVTLADAPLSGGRVRIEAGVRAAFLSRRTERIGLAPELHATATEPFHLATQLASLDHASLGRAAWVIGAANTAEALATIGRAPLEPEALHRETADVIEVARRLWDSWEDDAVIRDVATGRFLDRRRVHHVDFEGPTFSIVGPLITPRPPQGQVVVLGADTLGVTDRLDVALVGGDEPDAVRRRAGRARAEGAPLVFAEVEAALTDAPDTRPATDRIRYSGPPDGLVALLTELSGVVDGVRLHPARLDEELPILAERVLPAVAARAAGPTLRDTLGLPRPANRFATV